MWIMIAVMGDWRVVNELGYIAGLGYGAGVEAGMAKGSSPRVKVADLPRSCAVMVMGEVKMLVCRRSSGVI